MTSLIVHIDRALAYRITEPVERERLLARPVSWSYQVRSGAIRIYQGGLTGSAVPTSSVLARPGSGSNCTETVCVQNRNVGQCGMIVAPSRTRVKRDAKNRSVWGIDN